MAVDRTRISMAYFFELQGDFESPEFLRSSKAYVTVTGPRSFYWFCSCEWQTPSLLVESEVQTMVHDRFLYEPVRHTWTAEPWLHILEPSFFFQKGFAHAKFPHSSPHRMPLFILGTQLT